jgi:hypothetical protein
MIDMKFDKDRASVTISLLALAVSIISPFASYRWLNQVERDDRDRKQLIAWIADGAGGGADSGPNENTLSSVAMFDIVARKGGVLPVGNVQFLLQFEPRAIPYLKVSAHSDIETEPASIDDDGRFRIRLKNPLAPTARDVRIGVEITMTGHRKDRVFMQMGAPLRGVWLYSDAIAGLPISLPSSRQNAGGNEIR